MTGRPEPHDATAPTVVVAGRPNVGKSTLVNRVVGRRIAVVEERPGVTRDRLELQAEWAGRAFTVVDTGGWLGRGDVLDAKVAEQAERAVAKAGVVLMVVDVTVGVTNEDEDMARLLRRSGRPVLLVANKVDNEQREAEAWAFVSLGLGDPWPVSALHGRGTGDLLDEVVRRLTEGDATRRPPSRDTTPGTGAAPEAEATATTSGAAPGDGGGEDELASRGREGFGADGAAGTATRGADGVPEGGAGGHGLAAGIDGRTGTAPAPRVALVGRPNVGKSTLFNRLLGEERSVVHDMPGTTRDAVDPGPTPAPRPTP
jgi:GTPase